MVQHQTRSAAEAQYAAQVRTITTTVPEQAAPVAPDVSEVKPQRLTPPKLPSTSFALEALPVSSVSSAPSADPSAWEEERAVLRNELKRCARDLNFKF